MAFARPARRPVFKIGRRYYVRPLRHSSDIHTSSSIITTDPSYLPPSIRHNQIFKFACLKSRSLIRLSGPDVLPFLQGLITANISKFETASATTYPVYTAFLNAQGRVLNDVFLWRGQRPDESGEVPWLVDVDAASQGSLVAHLKKHKLRAKVKLENVSDEELRVYQGWVGDEYEVSEDDKGLHPQSVRNEAQNPPPQVSQRSQHWSVDQGVAISDPRPNMGMRWIATAEGTAYDALRRTPTYNPNAHGDCHLVAEEEYKLHRMLHGIAEGQKEIISGSALPQESNVDFFNGIDFRKGCYLGQELTIRTHHTGVVRKRILPVQLHKDYAPAVPSTKGLTFVDNGEHPDGVDWVHDLPPPGSNISKVSSRGRSTGKWLGGIGNIGLALCRLEMMTDIRLTDEPTQYDPDQEFKVSWDAQPGYEAGEVKIKAFVPEWLRDSIARSLKSRERDSTKDEEAEEVD